jgi:hypothetical protein
MISSDYGTPCLYEALVLYIVNFLTCSCKLSKLFLIATSFFGKRPSCEVKASKIGRFKRVCICLGGVSAGCSFSLSKTYESNQSQAADT